MTEQWSRCFALSYFFQFFYFFFFNGKYFNWIFSMRLHCTIPHWRVRRAKTKKSNNFEAINLNCTPVWMPMSISQTIQGKIVNERYYLASQQYFVSSVQKENLNTVKMLSILFWDVVKILMPAKCKLITIVELWQICHKQNHWLFRSIKW